MDNRDYGDEHPEEERRWGQSPLMKILRESAWLHLARKHQMALYERYSGPIKEEDVELRVFISKSKKAIEMNMEKKDLPAGETPKEWVSRALRIAHARARLDGVLDNNAIDSILKETGELTPSPLATMIIMQEVIAAQIYNNRSKWIGDHPNFELGTRSIKAEDVLPYVRDIYLTLEPSELRTVCEAIRDDIILNRVSTRMR